MRSRALLVLSWGAALIVPASVGAMLWRLCAHGGPTLGLELFFGDAPPLQAMLGRFPVWDGIWPAAAGTLSLLALTMALALLPGVGCGVYLACFAAPRAKRWLSLAVDLLAGVPSIVYGFFGLTTLVPLIREMFGGRGRGQCILTASLLLGIMILPTIIQLTSAAVKAVPNSYYEGSLALGATDERSVFRATVPAAKSGILASVVLAIGRAIGEAMAVKMVIGNQPRLTSDLLSGIRTLTSGIVIEMGYAEGLHREALIAAGIVLFVFILLINASFSVLKRREQQ